MPTHKQGTVDAPVTNKAMGKTDTNDLKAIFQGSPIHSGDMTDESIRGQYQDEVLDGEINDGGHTFGNYDTAYADAPDLSEVKTGGGGLPASAHVPNPSSPGEGSHNAADIPESPDGYGENPGSQWGSGVGSTLGPAESSKKVSAQKLGDYVMGSSTKE